MCAKLKQIYKALEIIEANSTGNYENIIGMRAVKTTFQGRMM